MIESLRNIVLKKTIPIVLILLIYSVVIIFIYGSIVYCPKYHDVCLYYNTLSVIIIIAVIVYYLFTFLTIIKSKYQAKLIDKEIGIGEKWCCIHIPYFREPGKIIENTLDAIVKSEYKKKVMIITIDGKDNIEVFQNLNNIEYNLNYDKKLYKTGIKIYDGFYKNVPYIVLLKENRTGKRDCQKIIFNLLSWSRGNDTQQDILNEAIYRKMMKLGVVLQEIKHLALIDADTKIEEKSLGKMINYLEMNEQYIGVCGETKVSNNKNIWGIIQNVEYYLTHKFIKLIENAFGNIFVLSGCFCVIKIDTIHDELVIDNKLIEEYTKNPERNNLHWMNLLNIGEDRYLSTLLLIKNKGQLKYLEAARCETICPDTLYSLMIQRRRWTNSMIHCLIELIKKTKKRSIKLIAIIELIIVILMPVIYIIGIYYAIQDITFSIIINLFPLFIIIILQEYHLVLQYFLFLIFQFIFMVLIPIYSFMNQDNTSW